MITQILLTIEHTTPIPDLTDQIAAQAYTMLKQRSAGLVDVTATIIEGENNELQTG